MAHTPRDAGWVIEKAFLVRFFADGGFRVEGPFPPRQVQRLIDTNECQAWLRDPALIAIWGREPIATISELFALAPEVTEIASRSQALSTAEGEPLSCATCPPLARRERTHFMKGRRRRKKRLSAPERHAIEAALKGEPFPGLVYRCGEFSLAGDMLVLPGFGRIPIPSDIPPQGKIVSVTLQEDGDGWTATFEIEKVGE